ncbi:MAG: hypothetical protein ACLP4V_33180 [Methylocella sp.]
MNKSCDDPGIAVFVGADRGDDGAGAILLTFIASFKMLAVPEIGLPAELG